MRRHFNLSTLIENIGEQLEISWLNGDVGRNKPLIGDLPGGEIHTLVGPLNNIHLNRIQIVGPAELGYLTALEQTRYQETLDRLFAPQVAAFLFCEDLMPPQDFIEKAAETDVALLGSPQPKGHLISNLRYHLSHTLAESVTVHGVFMEVLGRGVLLTGEPGIGKSEVALDLISRGHCLVADDAPILTQVNPDSLSGSCPYVLQDFLEVRGLGILNIREMYGDSAVKQRKYLNLIVHLEAMSEQEQAGMDRIQGSSTEVEMLRVPVTKVVVPVAPGRNLAILVETAVRQHMLLQGGYDSVAEFTQRQKDAIKQSS